MKKNELPPAIFELAREQAPLKSCQLSSSLRGNKLRLKAAKSFTLIELLIAVTIFGLIAIMGGQILTSTLRGKAKSEAEAKVKTEANYVLAIMEREIHNAASIAACQSSPPNTFIAYYNQDGITQGFYCRYDGNQQENGIVTIDNDRLTTEDVVVNRCLITCTPPSNPTTVEFDMEFAKKEPEGITLKPEEKATVELKTRIKVRSE